MPQKEVISLSVKKTFGLIFLIYKNWVFGPDIILDVEGIDLSVPIFMGFRDGSEDYR